MCFKERISSLHYQPGGVLSPWLWPLLPAEMGYALGVRLRLKAYAWGWLSTYRPEVPVISIGNLTTGGTGKTPLVMVVARGLIRAGKTVVILSRGYGAQEPLDYGRALDPRHGDEAYLMQAELPEAVVIVGRDRVSTLKQAVKDYRPDYVILDDGFQYVRLHRHINILLIDGARLLGNGHLLPVGPLREPVSELRRADLVFITKQVSPEAMQTVESWVQRYGKPSAQVVPVGFQAAGLKRVSDGAMEEAEALRGRSALAVSGIADPARFEADLEAQGLVILRHARFGDHHVYTASDVQSLLVDWAALRDQHPVIVTTDKDLPKLRSFLPPEVLASVYTLKMAPALDGQWFYYEFLTQMGEPTRAGDGHVHSGR